MSFIQRTDRLNSIANRVRLNAIRNLSGVIRTKSTGKLASSLRFFKLSTKNGIQYKFSMNWYGINILETAYPSGKKWGRGKLTKNKTQQLWFTPALNEQIDEFENAVAEDLKLYLESLIKP